MIQHKNKVVFFMLLCRKFILTPAHVLMLDIRASVFFFFLVFCFFVCLFFVLFCFVLLLFFVCFFFVTCFCFVSLTFCACFVFVFLRSYFLGWKF